MSFRIHSKPVVIAPVVAHPAFQSVPAQAVAAVPNQNIVPVVIPTVVEEVAEEVVAEPAKVDKPVETFKLRRKPNGGK
jgi:hypothetical protein